MTSSCASSTGSSRYSTTPTGATLPSSPFSSLARPSILPSLVRTALAEAATALSHFAVRSDARTLPPSPTPALPLPPLRLAAPTAETHPY
eukprot:1335002-Pleurochrysis_carterae.AAC.2